MTSRRSISSHLGPAFGAPAPSTSANSSTMPGTASGSATPGPRAATPSSASSQTTFGVSAPGSPGRGGNSSNGHPSNEAAHGGGNVTSVQVGGYAGCVRHWLWRTVTDFRSLSRAYPPSHIAGPSLYPGAMAEEHHRGDLEQLAAGRHLWPAAARQRSDCDEREQQHSQSR